MDRKRKALQSEMGWSNESGITVQGLDLSRAILGKLNLGDFAFLEIKGREPDAKESVVFNAVLATLVEHGMTPTVMTARLAYLGAPESLQGAVASGILSIGTTFAGTAEGESGFLQGAITKDTVAGARLFVGSTGSKTDGKGLAPWQLRRVIEYLDTQLPKRVELAHLAALAGLSQSHFSRAFKASTGMAPYQWQLDVRIRRAQALLLDTRASLDEVAEATGFADAVHFGRTFRRIAGATPAAWRYDQKS